MKPIHIYLNLDIDADDAEGAINGGKFWIPDGETEYVGCRSMSGGSFNANITPHDWERIDGEFTGTQTGARRYEPTLSVPVNTVAVDLSARLASEVNSYMNREWWAQVWKIIVMMTVTAIVGGILGALGGLLLGLEVVTAAVVGGIALAVLQGIGIGLSLLDLSTENPQLAWLIGTLIDSRDLGVSIMIRMFCNLFDCLFDTEWFTEFLGPGLYGLYMLTFDLDGTVGRFATCTWATTCGAYSADDIIYQTYDDYEFALLSGEAYNYQDYIEWFLEGISEG